MRARHLGFLLAVLCSAPGGAWQAPAPVPAAAPQTPLSAKIWQGHSQEYEEFLRTAPFERFEEVPVGVTRPQRAFFASGGLAASAAWKILPPGRDRGYWESYKSEIAAYELDKLLALGMVPPTVEKRWKGQAGAAVLWLPSVRPWKAVEHLPKPDCWTREAVRMKMFDNLIGNIDRNAGNLLVDGEWNLFLIDHSRAFVTDTRLVSEMTRIDRDLWQRMLALDEQTVDAALRRWIGRGSVRAILKRRDKMQGVIDRLLKNGNETLVYVK